MAERFSPIWSSIHPEWSYLDELREISTDYWSTTSRYRLDQEEGSSQQLV